MSIKKRKAQLCIPEKGYYPLNQIEIFLYLCFFRKNTNKRKETGNLNRSYHKYQQKPDKRAYKRTITNRLSIDVFFETV